MVGRVEALENIPRSEADAGAASAVDPRFDRLLSIEQSIVDAKRALIEAEIAMEAVHAGLACEPMPAPAVEEPAPDEPQQVSAWSRVFGPRNKGSIHWAVVPLGVQALALIMVGWFITAFAFKVMGPDQARALVASLRSAVIGQQAPAPPSVVDAASAVVGDTARRAAVLTTGEDAVVIYERNSPYPTHFSHIPTKDRLCLAEAIYYESRGEPVAGQIAVAQVVLNRTLAGPWPKTVCAVTNQGEENGEKCQFSYACMRQRLGKPFGDAWDNAQGLAAEILAGGAWLEEMLDATHFHRSDLKPIWRLALVEVGRFGRHTFYNSPTENRRPLSRLAGR